MGAEMEAKAGASRRGSSNGDGVVVPAEMAGEPRTTIRGCRWPGECASEPAPGPVCQSARLAPVAGPCVSSGRRRGSSSGDGELVEALDDVRTSTAGEPSSADADATKRRESS